MDYRIEKKDAFKLIAYSRIFTVNNGSEGIPALWREYYQKEIFKKAPGYLGIHSKKKMNPKEFLYGIGCNADDVSIVPEGFVELEIPAFTWAIFTCEGPIPNAIYHTWYKINEQWPPESDYEKILDYNIENYSPKNNSSNKYTSELWLALRKKSES